MATPPINVTGILRADTKQTDLTVGQYNNQARPGEIVIDLTTFEGWVANLDGSLNPVNNPLGFLPKRIINGNSTFGIPTANGNIIANITGTPRDMEFSEGVINSGANFIPSVTSTYGLGNSTHQWKDLYLSGTTAYVGNIPISETGGQIAVGGNLLATLTPDGSLSDSNIVTNSMTAAGDASIVGNATFVNNVSTGGNVSASGNITTPGDFSADNFNTLGEFLVVGNTNVTGLLVGNNYSASNLVVTSNMSVSGNVEPPNGLVADSITSATGNLTLTAIGVNSNITFVPTGTGSLDVSSKLIANLPAPVNNQDVSTQLYAQSVITGLTPRDAAKASSTEPLSVTTGGTVTYNNGTLGVGATLTFSSALVTLDNVIMLVGDRVLIKDEVNQAHNGIYVFTDEFTLTRATDSDTADQLAAGTFIFVRSGLLNGGNGYTILEEPAIVGTSPIVFLQVGGETTYTASQGVTVAGTELLLSQIGTGNTFSNTTRALTLTVNDKGQITNGTYGNFGPLSSLTVGNLTVGNLSLTTGLTIQSMAGTAFTGTISGAIFTGYIQGATFDAKIVGDVMTVITITRGRLGINQQIVGNGVASDITRITSQLSGPTGREGTYRLSTAYNLPLTVTYQSTGDYLIVTSLSTGTIQVGQTVAGDGVLPGTTITENIDGFGGPGLYRVNNFMLLGTQRSMAGSGTTLSVSSIASGNISVNQGLTGANVVPGTRITALGTGTGGIGTYTVSSPQAIFPPITFNSSSLGGNFSAGALSVPGFAGFAGNVSVAGNLIVNSNAVTGSLSARTLDATAGVSNVNNVTVNNLSNGLSTITQISEDANLRGPATFNRITDLRSNANLTITGGNSGQYLITNGSGILSWGYPSGGTNLSITGNVNITQRLNPPAFNLNNKPTPFYWDVQRGTSGLPFNTLVNDVSTSYDSLRGYRIITNDNSQRYFNLINAFTISDLQVRDRPILFEVGFSGEFNAAEFGKYSNIDYAFQVGINGYGFPGFQRFAYNIDDGLRSGVFFDFNFASPSFNVQSNEFVMVSYMNRRSYAGIYRLFKPLDRQIAFNSKGNKKISILYVWPSGTNTKYTYLLYNDQVVYAYDFQNNDTYDWTQDSGSGNFRCYIYGQGQNTSGTNVPNLYVNRFFVGSGQELYYRLNTGGSLNYNMPS